MQQTEENRNSTEGKQTSGEWLFKTLKPAGCIFVLLCAVMATVICFTSGKDPIKGYKPPQSSEYYAEYPDELLAELQANVFPNVNGIISAEAGSDSVEIRIAHDDFAVTRSVLLQYFDASLFELVQEEK